MTQHVAGKLYDSQLHAQAQSQEGDMVGAGILDRLDLAGDATVPETSWYQNAAYSAQKFFHVVGGNSLRIHPFDIDGGAAIDAAMLQCLHDADVGIMQLDIFSYQGYRHFSVGMPEVVYHLRPLFKIRLGTV